MLRQRLPYDQLISDQLIPNDLPVATEWNNYLYDEVQDVEVTSLRCEIYSSIITKVEEIFNTIGNSFIEKQLRPFAEPLN